MMFTVQFSPEEILQMTTYGSLLAALKRGGCGKGGKEQTELRETLVATGP
jgi:hypothetical protein